MEVIPDDLIGFCFDDLGEGIANSPSLVRGSVLRRAKELRELKAKGEKLPFDKFYPLHYGNPHLLDQPPISFVREVIAGAFCPKILEAKILSDDVAKRAKY